MSAKYHLETSPVANNCRRPVKSDSDVAWLPYAVFDLAGGNGAEILVTRQHNSDRRYQLEIIRMITTLVTTETSAVTGLPSTRTGL